MFRNRKYYNVDFTELNRRVRRQFDGNINYRRLLLLVFIVAIIILYIGPYIFSWLLGATKETKDPLSRCMDDRLTPFYTKAYEFNARIQHFSNAGDDTSSRAYAIDQKNIPYVGNGYFGLEIHDDARLFAKYGRHLSQPIDYRPIVRATHRPAASDDFAEPLSTKHAIVVDYVNGIVHKFQCFGSDFFIAHEFYAHRVIPQAFIQEIKITNMRNSPFNIELASTLGTDWPSVNSRILKLRQPGTNNVVEFLVTSGTVDLPKEDDHLIVTIITQKLPSQIALKKRGITKLDVVHVINYSIASKVLNKQKADEIESAAIETMTNLLQRYQFNLLLDAENSGDSARSTSSSAFKRQHTKVWNDLWESGFHISTSLADNAINGDQINATIYAVLSHVRSFEFESDSTDTFRAEIQRSLVYADGCYDSYYTLQAGSLWIDMNSIDALNKVAMSWLLTLEKQGCHNLIKAGASGVLQAMILSFGGFRFSNQHLELNIHPKHLHREYFFRRLNYGNMTHINVSIEVTEDNRAILYVALDRSDGKYYACDAGCLDEPVPLSRERTMFPVKLTEPVTSILYIASDKQHIEELRHAIHVKEVIEAPAHESHVISMHKHGHRLGGLPTFFWISIFAIIIVFHVFLCKLIVKEYCEPPEKLRYRYDKP